MKRRRQQTNNNFKASSSPREREREKKKKSFDKSSNNLGPFRIVRDLKRTKMSDPAIKLFGKSIALPSHSYQAGGGAGGGGGGAGGDEDKGFTNNEKIPTQTIDKEQVSANSEDKNDEHITTAASTANHESHQQKPPPSAVYNDDDDEQEKKEEEQQQQQSDAQDQKPALKKPDKILPCPRCNSLDTKFCYFNNYNVNQPRHFCKNCQRYWTAGGTMRNVPVGAGRRKNKNAAAAHYRQLTLTDAAALQAITPDAVHHPALKPNGTVLSFGSDAPLCESMDSVLSLADKTMKNCSRHRFQRIDEQSTGSSSNSAADHEGNGANVQEPAGTRNCQGFAPPPPYINGLSPWPYLWSLTPPPTPGTAPFCGLIFPIPIYPATGYWGCNAWSVPWVTPVQDSPSPSPTSSSPGSGSNSPTLGKHTREGNVLHKGSPSSSSAAAAAADGVNKQSNQDKCLWVPKTLRIDDPEEAAKSSIWVTMGFDKDDGMSSRAGGGLFKSFQTKAEVGSHKLEASQALHANPAALARSINFHEIDSW